MWCSLSTQANAKPENISSPLNCPVPILSIRKRMSKPIFATFKQGVQIGAVGLYEFIGQFTPISICPELPAVLAQLRLAGRQADLAANLLRGQDWQIHAIQPPKTIFWAWRGHDGHHHAECRLGRKVRKLCALHLELQDQIGMRDALMRPHAPPLSPYTKKLTQSISD